MPIHLEIEEHPQYLEVHYLGEGKVQELEALHAAITARCQQAQVFKCLCDIHGAQMALTTTNFYLMGRSTRVFGQAGIQVAVLGRVNQVDPQHFGELVAQNIGTKLRVFTDAELALAWLLAEEP